MFKKLTSIIVTCFLLMTSAQADTLGHFDYSGQEFGNIEGTVVKKVTRYRDEEVDSTCTRKVPRVVNRCEDETRYRDVCEWVEEHEECRTEHDRVCRTERRTREECTMETDYRYECRSTTRTERQCRTEYENERQCRYVTRYRRQCRSVSQGETCRNEPPRRVCRPDRNGGQRCTNVPGRRNCRPNPPRQVCEQVPYQDQECTTIRVPRQRCRNVQVPDQECRNFPYTERVCRDVPYNDEVCEDIPRRVCETIPAQNVCRKVPYTENVCRDVTIYEDEEYACKKPVKVPYTEEVEVPVKVSLIFSKLAGTETTKDIEASFNEAGKLVVKVDGDENVMAIVESIKKVESHFVESDNEESEKYVVKIMFADKAKLKSAFTPKSVSLGKDGFSFKVSDFISKFDLSGKVIVKRRFAGTVANQEFDKNDLRTIDKENGKVKLKLPMSLSRGAFKKRTVRMIFKVKPKKTKNIFQGDGVKLDYDLSWKVKM